MFEFLTGLLNRFFTSRLRVIGIVMMTFSCIIIARLFVLQIVRGADYQDNYELKVEKTTGIDAPRGNIYDRKGRLLAYDELAYAITIEDSGTYTDTADKNEKLNAEIAEIITNVERLGDKMDLDFGIKYKKKKYSFVDEGTARTRFRADVFGHAKISDLTYNSNAGFDESEASAKEIMEYLYSKKRFDISDQYKEKMRYKIAVIRYKMGLNSYQKYIATQIASNVSDRTVAYIEENQSELTGVDISEKSVRKYKDSEAIASVVGYTGTISTEEYDALSDKEKETTSLTDQVGKTGIEQYMNKYLMGKKGSETVYVDNVGNLIETAERVDPVSGGDVYLSIDKNLQQRTYYLLEKEIAGILYSKIENIKEYDMEENTEGSDIIIPIYDVYFALINNGLISIDKMARDSATDVEKGVYETFKEKQKDVLKQLNRQLHQDKPKAYANLSKEYQEYTTYIVKMLKSEEILRADAIDAEDEMQIRWTSEELSANEYLRYAIENNWVDITAFSEQSKYVDTDEFYDELIAYVLEELKNDEDFSKLVYKHAIMNDEISGQHLCAILYDQGVLEMDEETRNALLWGDVSAFVFLKECIRNLIITPDQLALEPCSGSSVMMNTRTGEVLACVSYPGYDSNRLTNSKDTNYYATLNNNLSNPLYNNATQQRTAPGSTFKLCTSTAGLAENKISLDEKITDHGVYDKVSNKPKCWIYPDTHGKVNVSEAIRDSCNYYFYEVGYRMSGGKKYNDRKGIKTIQKYAKMFGLGSKTGVEINENRSKLATEYPVMAAIGQSDNNITTVALARYCAAVTNNGKVFNLSLLDHVTDANGKTIKKYGPKVKNRIKVLNGEQWDAIHQGMRMVVADELTEFRGFKIDVAGKTGTAQINKHPNHALFVGYAPYDNPKVAVATRIAYGYTSHNAAAISKYILGAYFKDEESIALAESPYAMDVESASAVTD